MENNKLKEGIRFLAVGAAGANVAQMMEKKGYKAYYVNLAQQDLDLVNSPNKLHIKNGEGASKNRDKAKEVLSESIDEVLETLDNQITEKYVFTVFSLGGGTGSGCGPFLSSVIAENPEKKVGLVIVLPSMEESLQARINAYEALSEIIPLKNCLGSIFILDNNKRKDKLSINRSFAGLFDSFINIGDVPSSIHGVIDIAEQKTLLETSGVATKDYIDAVTTFSRAGYNLTDSEILADMAMQLEKVGDMDAESASKALLAGLQGYTEIDGYGMDQLIEKAQALNDKIDIIGNTASISQKEVAGGIQAVGSVMSDANTSIDEFLALLGAGNRAVQDSNKVALAIRTSALRIRSCIVELQEMGEETDNVIESTSTLAAKIKALTNIDGSGGVNILEADGETFRSIYDIYNDIAKVYDKMSDTDSSALLDLIAGKNRSNQISAILQNMSEANELLEGSLSAAGTASAEYEIYLQSSEAATERFGVAMTETYNNILNGETVKGLTNAGTAVLDFANKWGIVEGTLKGLLGLGILKGITTLTIAFKNSALQVSNYGSALNAVNKLDTVRGTQKYADVMKTLKSSCVNLTDAQLKQVLSNNALSDSERVKVLQYRGLTKAQAQAKLAQGTKRP